MKVDSKHPDASDARGLYPIRTVSQLTGVHPVTLRAWERRYGLVTPMRTPKGHRMYTQEDVERIRRIMDHLRRGVAVSQLRPLLDGEPILPDSDAHTSSEQPRDPWEKYLERMLHAARNFDDAMLDSVYNDALSLYPVELIASRLTNPVLRQLGAEWREQENGIAQEHFFSHFLRNKLGARLHHLSYPANGPRLLGACPEGESHELGLLQFALAAAIHGYRTILLGGNIPVGQIASAAHTADCAAIVLSASAVSDDSTFRSLEHLVATTPLPVLVGGNITLNDGDRIASTGAISVGVEFHQAIAKLDRLLARR